ncbi:MAG: TonB-dependent receptor [Bacteroidota bacterium]
MNKKNLILLLLFYTQVAFSQQKVSVSGYIRDAETGEDLIGAAVYAEAIQNGTVTNIYGYFTFSVPVGVNVLRITYVGYEPFEIRGDFKKDQTINIDLKPSSEQLEEVTVTGKIENANISKNEMSTIQIEPKTIKSLPAVLGEPDVIKAIQLLPGITSAGDGASGFNVRGGNVDQNLILLDEGIIYNSAHLLGLYSVINPDAVKDIKLYKGGIPAKYGGRASSVMDVRQKEGNSKRLGGEAGVGLISARALLEGPIVKDKSSFLLAARRSYGDAFLQLVDNNNIAYFYDLNVKTNYKFSDKDRVFLSGYFGRDKFELGSIFSNSWGNATATLRWNHLFSEKLFANFSGIYSNYDYSLDNLTTGSEFNRKSNIITYNAKADFAYFSNDQNQVEFGVDAKRITFKPGKISPIEGSNVNVFNLDESYATELAGYISIDKKFGPVSITLGTRYSAFIRQGEQSINIYENNQPIVYNANLGRYENGTVIGTKTYKRGEQISFFQNIEPRLNITTILNSATSIKASYNRMAQYMQLISNTNSPTPLDIWTPSGPFIKPLLVDQVALGLFKNFKENTYEASVELYYKQMQNVIDYVDGADLLTNNFLETELLSGKGRSVGLELYVKKNTGKLTGWISYTLSRSEQQITGINSLDPGINNGEYYALNFDKMHDLSITSMYELSERVFLSANFVYATGMPTTYPEGRYEFANLVVPHYGQRNSNRLPDYHRFDISLTLEGKKKSLEDGGHNWVFGLYNIYNRKNANSIFFVESEDNPGQVSANKSYLFGITPSIIYNFKF